MGTLISSQIQNRLQDGSCLLTSAPQFTAPSGLVSGPQTSALLSGSKTASVAAVNKTALTAGTATLKTGAGAGTALGAGTIAGAILGVLVVGLIAYGVNKTVRAYIK